MVDPGTLSGERLAILVQNALVSGEPPEGSDLAFFDTQVVDESSPCVSVAHLSLSRSRSRSLTCVFSRSAAPKLARRLYCPIYLQAKLVDGAGPPRDALLGNQRRSNIVRSVATHAWKLTARDWFDWLP